MNPIPANILCAAELLEGTQLINGWTVLSKVPNLPNSTGGNFSVPYFVERQEGTKVQRAFLKALNFRRLAAAPDFARAVQEHIAAFNFERDTLNICKDKRLRRVATLLDAGEHRFPNNPLPVCYIIFELAHGDARRQLASLVTFDLAWTLRTLHQVCVAMNQLHTHGIAHQDLKPSNVLFFEAFGAKVGDLGSADNFAEPAQSPRGSLGIAGDPSYAPPELFYNEVSLDWKVRRLGCDLYLLGSIVVFFFTGGASMTGLLQSKVPPSHSPVAWQHDYRSVLPYIRDAFEQALDDIKPSIPPSVQGPVTNIIRCLCEPDPRRRGHPSENPTSQFGLERIISAFDLLASKVEYGLLE